MKAIVMHSTDCVPVMNIEPRDIPQKRMVCHWSEYTGHPSIIIRTGDFGDTPLPLVLGNEGAGGERYFCQRNKGAVYGGRQLPQAKRTCQSAEINWPH